MVRSYTLCNKYMQSDFHPHPNAHNDHSISILFTHWGPYIDRNTSCRVGDLGLDQRNVIRGLFIHTYATYLTSFHPSSCPGRERWWFGRGTFLSFTPTSPLLPPPPPILLIVTKLHTQSTHSLCECGGRRSDHVRQGVYPASCHPSRPGKEAW